MVRIGSLLGCLLLVFASAAFACENNDSRCDASGKVQRCISGQWQTFGESCGRLGDAPQCSVGDTKCGAGGTTMECKTGFSGGTSWTNTYRNCAADRDPADTAPSGYGGYRNPYQGSGAGDASSTRAACSIGQSECGDDRRTRRCVMRGGAAAWEIVAGSRCGDTGFRN